MRVKPSYPRLQRDHPLAEGLVGAWAFHEGAGLRLYDVSQNGETGDLLPAATPPLWVAGPMGPCLRLNGTSQQVNVGDPILTQFPISYSAWFRTTNTANVIKAILSQSNTGNANNHMTLSVGSANTISWTMRGTTATTAGPTVGPLVNDGLWHHAVGVSLSGSNHAVYLDGSLMGTSSVAVDGLPAPNTTRIGNRARSGDNAFFPGDIDDCRIYNRALTAQEVAELYADPWSVYIERTKTYLFLSSDPDPLALINPAVSTPTPGKYTLTGTAGSAVTAVQYAAVPATSGEPAAPDGTEPVTPSEPFNFSVNATPGQHDAWARARRVKVTT